MQDSSEIKKSQEMDLSKSQENAAKVQDSGLAKSVEMKDSSQEEAKPKGLSSSQTITKGGASNEGNNDSEDESDSDEEDDPWGRFGFFRRKPEPEVDPKELWAKEEKLTLEERRKRYHCGKRFTQAEDVIHLDAYYEKNKIETPDEVLFEANAELNKKISLWHGDITRIECDAIVNAANEGCLGGGGVDGAIHSAAGRMLYQECRTLHGCPTGETKITRGYDLPAKFVLHSVGPVGEDPEMLRSCYETCLELVEKHSIRTVVFCGISTGIFGYPLTKAARVALSVVRKWIETGNNKDKVDKIILCTFLDKERYAYDQLTPRYFPPAKSKSDSNTQEAPTTVEKKE